MRKKKNVAVIAFGLFPLLLIPIFLLAFLILSIGTTQGRKDCKVSASTTAVTSSEGAADTDWTKAGTTAYNNAKYIFDTFVSLGVGGGLAAGIVGWVQTEGGTAIIDRAEGHYGMDEASNGISAGVVPIPSGNYPVGGGGIYQFTPYTKYAPLGDPKWLDGKQMTEFVVQLIRQGDWNPGMDMSGQNRSFEEAAKDMNPQTATLAWQCYERGDISVIPVEQKKADAQKAFDLFGGSSFPFDVAKFNKNFGLQGGSEVSESNENPSSSSSKKKNLCGSTSKGGTFGKDGTGLVTGYSNFSAFKADELPDDLKQYALDPRSVGLGFRSSQGWHAIASSGGQCTDFSASMMYAMWEKNGEHPYQTLGNGQDVAANWASKFGGSVTHEPSAGSVFSTSAALEGNGYGHTGVVSHTFEDGSFLIVEQNYSTLSGENGGFGQFTWSYRYVPKSSLNDGWTFYSPSQAGYKIVDSLKTVG